MKRTASAVWHGGLKDGHGTVSTQSGALRRSPYSFGSRFEDHVGTNPEELLAAALAACFTMALSAKLVTLKFIPKSVKTTAAVTLESVDSAWTLSKIELETV